MESKNLNRMKYSFSDTFNKVNRRLKDKINPETLAEIVRFEREMAYYFEDIKNLPA